MKKIIISDTSTSESDFMILSSPIVKRLSSDKPLKTDKRPLKRAKFFESNPPKLPVKTVKSNAKIKSENDSEKDSSDTKRRRSRQDKIYRLTEKHNLDRTLSGSIDKISKTARKSSIARTASLNETPKVVPVPKVQPRTESGIGSESSPDSIKPKKYERFTESSKQKERDKIRKKIYESVMQPKSPDLETRRLRQKLLAKDFYKKYCRTYVSSSDFHSTPQKTRLSADNFDDYSSEYDDRNNYRQMPVDAGSKEEVARLKRLISEQNEALR